MQLGDSTSSSVGLSLAREMLLAGRVLTGEEALAFGLLRDLVEAVGLWDAGDASIDRLSDGDCLAPRLTQLALALRRARTPDSTTSHRPWISSGGRRRVG